MKFKVTAIAVDLTATPVTYSQPMVEVVDTEITDLFVGCDSLQSVEVRYEQFWNYLNNPDVLHNPREKIKVLTVERL